MNTLSVISSSSCSGLRPDDASAFVEFGEEWTVRPSRELMERLGQIVGRDGVELVYAPRVDA